MPLKIEFVDGDLAGKVMDFADDVEHIAIGRDPDRCQVVIPPDERTVGREHCSIARVRGNYYMEMAADRRVSIDGELMETVQALPKQCVVQIGPGGPHLRLTVDRSANLAATLPQDIDAKSLHRRAAGAADEVDVQAIATEARQSSQAALLAVVLSIAIIIIGGAIYFMVESDVDEIEAGQARNSESVETLAGTVGGLSEDMTLMGADLPTALDKAKQSTYLVVLQDKDGIEQPFGTAWVMAPGQLATNAHVAERFNVLKEGESVILRGSDGKSEFVARDVFIHPGYDSFAGLWQDYVPIQINAAKESDPVRSAGMAADVGIIYVDENADIGAPLLIADSSRQVELQAGDPVGYVGFPIENMALGGVNITSPVPQTQVGRITSITDYFNAPAEPGDGLLIQHSLPATGGASGSPLINARGEVVGLLSAVNFIVVGGKRIPSAASVNFAQRSTLLEEMHSTDLDQIQEARTNQWNNRIVRFYESGRLQNRAPEMEDLIAGWEAMVATRSNDEIVTGSESVASELFPLDSLNINPLAMGAGDSLGAAIYGKEVEMQVQAGKDYLLAVEGDGTVGVHIEQGTSDIRIVDVMDIKPNLKAIAFRVEKAGKIKAQLGATEPTGTLGYDLREATISKSTPDSVAQAAMRRWLRDLQRSDSHYVKGDLVRQWSGEMTAKDDGGEALKEVTLDGTGHWFIIAICMDQENINLSIRDSKGEVIGEDAQPDWYPFVAVETSQEQSIVAQLTASRTGVPYRLFLYRASKSNDPS
ncbi:MAG: trypsin-like peptidase domain-containing protein [Phycisphaerales bacterium]|nr:trypsin-like peptidase domain-containing protein [Phycisphaerales bacterium]